MEAIKHLQRLKTFPTNCLDLLESMHYLREQTLLPPLWISLEAQITQRFLESLTNKEGWAWKLENDDLPIFSAWRYNTSKPLRQESPYKDSMKRQLDDAQKVLNTILNLEICLEKAEREAMSSELEQVFLQVREKLIREAEALTF